MGRVSARQFDEQAGLPDWRALAFGASAYFPTGSFDSGARLVHAVAQLAGATGRSPDVDLRVDGVTLRVLSRDGLELTEAEVDLARRISEAAHTLGIAAEPDGLQDVGITVNAVAVADVLPFWRALLGYDAVGDEDLVDPQWRTPGIWFQQVGAPRTERNRVHLDLRVPHDQAEARVARAVAAGGTVVYEEMAPAWCTLRDPEGNEVDVATWRNRPWEE